MIRLAAGVEYDGSRFHGWQSQEQAVRTVQDEVEAALSFVANHPIKVVCAGRTDTGVHATAQVIHFDTQARRDARNWLLGANVNLPEDVNLTWIQAVNEDFHARFGAYERAYRYLIINRQAKSALWSKRATWVKRSLNADSMQRAAQALVGTHDFSSYRAQGCQAKSPIRTVKDLTVMRSGDFLQISIRANAFLHHMVRNIAGVLLAIGVGDEPENRTKEILDLRNRALGGVTAPPDGLYLTEVNYPEPWDNLAQVSSMFPGFD